MPRSALPAHALIEGSDVGEAAFAARIIEWQRRAGRHQLPWQGTRDPYRIWVSEIMLQQTQVSTVIPYFHRFLERFASVVDLADAAEEQVLAAWSGLGYYARGRNLHRAARIIRDQHGGIFPRSMAQVMALPGVGRSTAGAICAFAYGQREPILDGNVKRVLTRVFGIHGYPGERDVEAALWALSQRLLPTAGIESYTQGVMDLGASLCVRTRPQCEACPLQPDCVAYREHLTDRLPTAKARKALPQRHTIMLMLWNGSEVLLERRPAPGIWGGLWCFPEIPDDAGQQAALDRHALSARRMQTLAQIRHGFTHYHLTIEPRLLEVAQRAMVVNDAAGNTRWMGLQEARASGLPAPVRVLLDAIDGGAMDAGPGITRTLFLGKR